MAQRAIRVTLSTGKIVVIREPNIGFQEQALRIVGTKAGNNQALQNYLSGLEMLKMIIANVDEKDVTYKDLDGSLKDMFSVSELGQIQKALESWMGEGADYVPKIEAVVSGI